MNRYINLLFVTLPLITILYLSVVSAWTFPILWKAQYTLSHWKSLMDSSNGLFVSFLLSIFISGSIAVLATLFGYFISRQLLFDKNQSRFIQLAFYPYLIAPVILGAMLQFYFVRFNLTGTTLGVFIAQAFFIFPYSVLLLSTFWNDKIRQLAFQAKSLGATDRQVNQQVLFPMARPWILLSLVQCFLISWFEYGITQYIGVGKVETLTIRAMNFVKEANPHQAALSACLMILPVLLILVINQQLLTKRSMR